MQIYDLNRVLVVHIICKENESSKNVGKPQDGTRIHAVPALKLVLQSVTDGSSSLPSIFDSIRRLYHIPLIRLYMKNTPISICVSVSKPFRVLLTLSQPVKSSKIAEKRPNLIQGTPTFPCCTGI